MTALHDDADMAAQLEGQRLWQQAVFPWLSQVIAAV
jgi:hypothetical protein